MKDDQGLWNFIFSLIFLGQIALAMFVLFETNRMPTHIPLFDFAIIVLATYRLTRLFVYDKITQFVRNWFLDQVAVVDDLGQVTVVREKPARGPRLTLSELLDCPWCFGIWAALAVSFLYFLSYFAWYPIFMLAVAGLATFVHLTSNMIGWRAELLKETVDAHKNGRSSLL